jgi:hypothetical protein
MWASKMANCSYLETSPRLDLNLSKFQVTLLLWVESLSLKPACLSKNSSAHQRMSNNISAEISNYTPAACYCFANFFTSCHHHFWSIEPREKNQRLHLCLEYRMETGIITETGEIGIFRQHGSDGVGTNRNRSLGDILANLELIFAALARLGSVYFTKSCHCV